MRSLPVLLLLWGLSWASGLAQTLEPAKAIGTIYGGLGLALPLGSFRQTYPEAQATGMNLGVLIKPGAMTLPLEAGLEVNYLVDGIAKRKVTTFSPNYTIKTTHTYLPLHAVLRLKPRVSRTFMPFADGLAGMTIFNTRSKIKQDFFTAARNEERLLLNKSNSTVFSYGLAAGLQSKKKGGVPALAIRLIYLEGLLGNYVKRGDLRIDQQGYPVYRFTRSETSLLLLQLQATGILPAY